MVFCDRNWVHVSTAHRDSGGLGRTLPDESLLIDLHAFRYFGSDFLP